MKIHLLHNHLNSFYKKFSCTRNWLYIYKRAWEKNYNKKQKLKDQKTRDVLKNGQYEMCVHDEEPRRVDGTSREMMSGNGK